MVVKHQVIVLSAIGGVIFVLAAIGGWRLFQIKRAEQTLQRFEQELMRPYTEDRVGGKTPEETLRLFLEALKKKDVDLAAKYFVLDKQDEWRRSFILIKEKGEWGNMVKDIEKAQGGPGTSDTNYQYDVLNEEGVVGAIVDLIKQPNGIWKIRSL